MNSYRMSKPNHYNLPLFPPKVHRRILKKKIDGENFLKENIPIKLPLVF